jgi:hypothetical protein
MESVVEHDLHMGRLYMCDGFVMFLQVGRGGQGCRKPLLNMTRVGLRIPNGSSWLAVGLRAAVDKAAKVGVLNMRLHANRIKACLNHVYCDKLIHSCSSRLDNCPCACMSNSLRSRSQICDAPKGQTVDRYIVVRGYVLERYQRAGN